MDGRTSFEKQHGTVSLKRAFKGLCSNLEEVASQLKRMGACLQMAEVEQTDYIFQLPSRLSGRNTRRIKFRLVDGKPFGVYLYDRFHEDSEVTFEFLRPSDLTLVSALQSSEVPYVRVSKTRSRWNLEDTIIHLDQVQGLGDVVEIETVNGNNIPDQLKDAVIPYLIKHLDGSNEDYFQPVNG
jgi:adenylate cyclase class IV